MCVHVQRGLEREREGAVGKEARIRKIEEGGAGETERAKCRLAGGSAGGGEGRELQPGEGAGGV